MKAEGYNDFTINKHTGIWKELKEKGVDLSRYGVQLSDNSWYWYDNWIDQVKAYCEEHYKIFYFIDCLFVLEIEGVHLC